MKKLSIFLIMFVCMLSLAGCSNNHEQNNMANANNISDATRLNADVNVTSSNMDNNINITEITKNAESSEEQLASFSTKLGGKDTPRSRNIGITTNTLNGTTVDPCETFSFCKTIGEPTVEKGYEKADSFDADGNTVQTLGGGNCQVSSTLYNVVLQIPEIKVTERHAHSKPVHYVGKDKDAAVSYGSVDLKFKNNTDSTIKIYADSDLNGVNIRIVKI